MELCIKSCDQTPAELVLKLKLKLEFEACP